MNKPNTGQNDSQPIPGSIADRLRRLNGDDNNKPMMPRDDGIIPGSFEYHKRRFEQADVQKQFTGDEWPAQDPFSGMIVPSVGSLYDDRDDAPEPEKP